mmetsp:Transcript_26726/g.55959  ORF Transcript_26726/g.55959 Transcript_26726/m.55959 type:complete len:94 (+) Transcript_26726:183-464(+)
MEVAKFNTQNKIRGISFDFDNEVDNGYGSVQRIYKIVGNSNTIRILLPVEGQQHYGASWNLGGIPCTTQDVSLNAFLMLVQIVLPFDRRSVIQ